MYRIYYSSRVHGFFLQVDRLRANTNLRMKETGLTISGMAMILSCCWTILFLTTFPALVFGGRRDPAAGKSSSHSLILHPHGHAELNPGFMQFRFSGRSDLMNSCRAYVMRKLKFTKVDRPSLSPHLVQQCSSDDFIQPRTFGVCCFLTFF
jgi:hypothetical protein